LAHLAVAKKRRRKPSAKVAAVVLLEKWEGVEQGVAG
jgi:hypothetical protein